MNSREAEQAFGRELDDLLERWCEKHVLTFGQVVGSLTMRVHAILAHSAEEDDEDDWWKRGEESEATE